MSAKCLLERKEEILHILKERSQLDGKFHNSIENASTMTALEDGNRPYKEKKNTCILIAIKKRLAPLANMLESAKLSKEVFMSEAKCFVRREVKDSAMTLRGAQNIVLERYVDVVKEKSLSQ